MKNNKSLFQLEVDKNILKKKYYYSYILITFFSFVLIYNTYKDGSLLNVTSIIFGSGLLLIICTTFFENLIATRIEVFDEMILLKLNDQSYYYYFNDIKRVAYTRFTTGPIIIRIYLHDNFKKRIIKFSFVEPDGPGYYNKVKFNEFIDVISGKVEIRKKYW